MVSSSWLLWVAGIVLFQFVVGRVHTTSANATRHQQSHSVDTASISSFPLRNALHLQRKAQHALTGLLFYAATFALSISVAIALLFTIAALFFAVHELRKTHAQVDALYIASFRGILRQDEAAKRVLPGAFYFLVGTGITATLYPVGVLRLAVLHLSFGDPAASLFGTLYGHHSKDKTTKKKNKSERAATVKSRSWISTFTADKSFTGFAGAFLVSSLASFAVFYFGEPGLSSSVESVSLLPLCAKALYAGGAAAIAESINLGWDDNLTLPVLAGLFLQLGSLAFGFQY